MDYLTTKTEGAIRQALWGALSFRTGLIAIPYESLMQRVASEFGFVDPRIAEAWHKHQVGYVERPHRNTEEHPDNRRLLTAIWRLIGDGLVYPRFAASPREGCPLPIDRLIITERGRHVLGGGEDHPLHPRFMSRFASRADGMSGEVVARMEDAISCLERSLFRPAVIMIGLAFEETIRVSHAAMVKLAYISKAAPPRANAKDVLDDIQKAIPSWPSHGDEQHRLTKAVAAAESVRTDRNAASHPGVVLNDAAAIEELLILAGRQIPVFWEICVQHAIKTNGFVVS